MSEPTWTAKMFDENKALKAKVEEERYILEMYKTSAERRIKELQTKVEELEKQLKDALHLLFNSESE